MKKQKHRLSASAYRPTYIKHSKIDFLATNLALHQFFEEQVERTPDNIAIVYNDEQLTYQELNEASNQLARFIRAQYQQFEADTLIALSLERSPELLIGILGILKAGGAYVPIDPNYPADRIQYMLADTKTQLILTQRHWVEKLQPLRPESTLIINLDDKPYAQERNDNLLLQVEPSHLAYVIYTSGTTGQPKGVLINHAGVINRIDWMQRTYPLTEVDVVLQKTPYSFDVSVWELLWAHWTGAKLVMAKPLGHKDSQYLDQLIHEQGVTVIHFVPSMLSAFTQSTRAAAKKMPSSLRYIFCSGEALSCAQVQACYAISGPQLEIHNLYGPTEASIEVTSFFCARNVDSIYIGKPIQNIQIYVLNAHQKPVALGSVGELYIGGIALARGYLNQLKLTAEHFVPNPFAIEADKARCESKLYKTGDLARFLPDGNIEYIGRNDFQVKIRGYRIELAEIEQVLLSYEQIHQAVVLTKLRSSQQTNDYYLVAYYVSDVRIDAERLINFLLARLPEYMVPRVFVHRESFPLTINGKLDRHVLLNTSFETNESAYHAPNTELEVWLCQLWKQILKIDKIGITDDFFSLGGDSILSIQLTSELRKRNFQCSVSDVFEHRCIERLAHHLTVCSTEKIKINAEQGTLIGSFNLLPIQCDFFNSNYACPAHWNQSFLVRVPRLSIEKLQRLLPKLILHHDMLRVTFKRNQNGVIEQVYKPFIDIKPIGMLDISHWPKDERANRIEEVLTDWQSDFNLEAGPLWRIGYLHGYSDGSARLYFALHHLIVDAVSWRILIDDIQRLYADESLGNKSSSYRQWVAAVNDYAEIHMDEAAYWQAQQTGAPDYSSFGQITASNETNIYLDKHITQQLLGVAGLAYHTEINDLLLSALAYALSTWYDCTQHVITLEGHGRELIDDTIDTSRTFGWFTTMYPVKLAIQDNLASSIKSIKESLRSIPNKGIGYGALGVKHNFTMTLPPISFNYLGQFDSPSGYWQVTDEPSGMSVHAKNVNQNIIDINGMVLDGVLHFSVVTRLSQDEGAQLAASFKAELIRITKHCVSLVKKNQCTYTPSDFSTVKISAPLLNCLQERYEIEAIYPANSLQQGFIYHALSQPMDDAYCVQLLLDYRHLLDVAHYQAAWRHAIQTYPILRTCFNWDEELIQIICRSGSLEFILHDISASDNKTHAIRMIQEEDRAIAFDLQSPTLLRLHLIKHADALYTVIQSQHHSIVDGWSGPILLQQVHAYYQQLQSETTVVIQEDAAYGRAQAYLATAQGTANPYWQAMIGRIEQVNDLNALLSKTTNLDAVKALSHPKQNHVEIKDDAYVALKGLAQQEGLTLAVLLQFAWHKLIQVYTRDTQTVVGTTVSGRTIPVAGIEASVGLYINTLPLMVDWSKPILVREQLQTIHEQLVSLNHHSAVNLVSLQKEGKRLFHSLFVFENYPSPTASDDLEVTIQDAIEVVDYPFAIVAYEAEKFLHVSIRYDGDYLAEAKAVQLLAQIKRILNQLPSQLNEPHTAISLLTSEEYQRVVYEWNTTDKDCPSDKTIHQLFEEQVKRTPNNIAVVYEDQKLTYRELNQEANQLARYIRRYFKKKNSELKPDTLIALCLDRSLEMIIGILGVLKAGGAYVPIDPNHPAGRIRYVLEDTKSVLLLTQQHWVDAIEQVITSSTQVIALDTKPYQKESYRNVSTYSKSTDLAYVIYTSGTTGAPKGVMQMHRNIMRLFSATTYDFHFNADDVWTLYHSYIFDFSVWEIWGALIHGGKLVVPSHDDTRDINRFYQLCLQQGVTILNQTPRAFQLFSEHVIADVPTSLALRYVIFGGEFLQLSALTHWWSVMGDTKPTLVNMYGITETTVHVTLKMLSAREAEGSANIGKAIHDLTMYVLDQNKNPLPIGVIGELYIGGAGLARGYHNQPELTSQRFISNPFASEKDKAMGYTRLYKTGDLVRWLSDGDLEYIGRNDFQIKIRGYRIELGEIEHVLSTHADIKQCVVISHNNYLIAYYISPTTLTDTTLCTYLSKQLPEYMIPSAFIPIDAFSLTTNGKLDLSVLPAPDFMPNEESYIPPETNVEKDLCQIWADVLKFDRVGMHDDFFRLGGDSILSIRLVAKMKTKGHAVSVRALFMYRTIARLLKECKKCDIQEKQYKPFSLIPSEMHTHVVESWQHKKGDIEDVYPASYLQMGMIVEFLKHQEQGTYHDVFLYHISTNLNEERLLTIWQQLITKHPLLRTSFIENDKHGYLSIQWHDISLDEHYVLLNNLSDESELIDTEKQMVFPLHRPGLFKILVYPIQKGGFTFVFSFHHAITDGWSVAALMAEFVDAYVGKHPISEEKLPQYPQFVARELSVIADQKYIGFWRDYLADHESSNQTLLLNQAHTSQKTNLFVTQEISAEQSPMILALARRLAVSPDVIFLGLYALTLSRFYATSHVMIGLVVNNRLEEEGGDKVFGLHLNTIPLRIEVKKDAYIHIDKFISSVATEKNKLHEYKAYPYGRLKSELSRQYGLGRNIYSCAFNYVHFHVIEDQRKHGEIMSENGFERSSIPLIFNVTRYQNTFVLTLNGSNQFIDQDTAQRILAYITHYLTHLLQTSFEDNPFLTPTEHQRMVYEWNNTSISYPKNKTIYQLFEEQVKRTPNSIAVVYEDQQLTYRELNQEANQLARYIRRYYKKKKSKLKPDTLIALCLDRSLAMIIGILGVLKAGGAYVPIDPSYPTARIRFILDDTQSQLLLTQQYLMYKLGDLISNNHFITLDDKPYQLEKMTDLAFLSQAKDLAYVMYTSGTTGLPKGVLVEHQSLLFYQTVFKHILKMRQPIVATLTLSYCFDGAFPTLFSPLLTGGRLIITQGLLETSCEKYFALLLQQDVNLIKLTPSMLNIVSNELTNYPRLLTVMIGGETYDKEIVHTILENKKISIFNQYGPTECAVGSSGTFLSRAVTGQYIGKIYRGKRAYVLDENLSPVPIGVIGELYIGGAGLARGYLNRKDLTVRVFINNPFATDLDIAKGYTRLYKTGDKVRWLSDGNLEYMGRDDFQVKLRGYRIELGEIECALLQYSHIKQCVIKVLEKESKAGRSKYLVAYYVSDALLDEDRLISDLRAHLAEYMIPRLFVRLDAFPLTVNGKLDRNALPAPDFNIDDSAYVAPQTALEETLCTLWQAVLFIERVGTRDDFFKLGGHSILAIQLVSTMNRTLNITVNIADIFRYKTIANLAQEIAKQTNTHAMVKPLNTQNQTLPMIYFIHPSSAGCEVYQALADWIALDYQSIGIDNFNIYHKTKLDRLADIATYYLNEIEHTFPFSNEIKLCGWSFGGQIALEMACQLEKKGFKQINVYLLDTFLVDKVNEDHFSRGNLEENKSRLRARLNSKNLEKKYIDAVCDAYEVEYFLIYERISEQLQYSNVTLFQATEVDAANNSKHSLMNDNNIQSIVAKKIKIVRLNCDHYSILDEKQAIVDILRIIPPFRISS